MNRESLAAVFRGVPGEIELAAYSLREPKRREVMVRVEACTLCGSDLHSFHGRRSVPVPTILGHEMVGRIEAFGSDTERLDIAGVELAIGDRIVWGIVAHCGTCTNCMRDLPQKCLNAVKYGHERFGDTQDFRGGLAEHCILAPGTSIVRVPESLAVGTACLVSCAGATVFAALESVGEMAARSACVIGGGTLGLIACAALARFGATRIVCLEPSEERRRIALTFGATETCDPAAWQQPSTGETFDLLFEMSGHGATLMKLWPAIAIGGRVALVGSVFPDSPVPISLDSIVRRNLSIMGIHNYAPRHLLAAVEFLSSSDGQYPFESLVERWFPLLDTPAAFRKEGCKLAIRIGIRI